MDTYNDRPAVMVTTNPEEIAEVQEAYRKAYSGSFDDEIEEDKVYEYSSLATYIMGIYDENKDLRATSGIEDKIVQSLRAYNGHYDPEDIARIRAAGGSEIYMNLTPTKCRAAMSWIRDIMMPAKEKAWGLYPTDRPELPPEVVQQIDQQINNLVQQSQTQAPQGPEGQAQPPQAMQATSKLQEINQLKRDIEEAISDEIYKVAMVEVKKYETIISDQLQEGQWDKAFSEFIEDFCVFPTAIIKAPIITKKKRLTYSDGQVVENEDFIFLNKRVSPFDIYPSADATEITDGNLCEHLRFSRKELYNLIGVPNYHEENIRKVLDNYKDGYSETALDSTTESDKVIEEYRGDVFRSSKNIIHGVHFHGSIPWQYLDDWGFKEDKIGTDENKEFEVEAILAGGEIIKCVLNSDPLLRRPYYKASWQSIPGSFWGRSLPELMRDIQRMCNATARALSNNMSLAAGPQIEIYTDRLADDSEIDAIEPFHVWQLQSDPSGAGGRAITFWQPTSNAQELLAVYKEFELRADDATGIPRYAYGNDNTGAAAQTASGLSMLLESAAKGIKDSVRNIDFGIIKPRIEYQFYWNVISNDDIKFSGDVNVVPKGSEILTLKGASEMRRNEFLQILANPTYLDIVGVEGIADILREMAKSLGLGINIVPSRIELKKKQQEAEAMQQQMMQQQSQAEAQKAQAGLQATQMQVEGQMQMHQQTQQLKAEEIQAKIADKERDRQLRAIEMQMEREAQISKETAALQKQQMIEDNKSLNVDKTIALSIKTGDKSNIQ